MIGHGATPKDIAKVAGVVIATIERVLAAKVCQIEETDGQVVVSYITGVKTGAKF